MRYVCDVIPDKEDLCRLYEEGLTAYRARRWDEATIAFQEFLETQPDDGPSRLFIERIQAFRESPPGDDWDGVCHMRTK